MAGRPRRQVITCTIEGCERLARSRGWCDLHYGRWHKYGDPNASRKHYDLPATDCRDDDQAFAAFWLSLTLEQQSGLRVAATGQDHAIAAHEAFISKQAMRNRMTSALKAARKARINLPTGSKGLGRRLVYLLGRYDMARQSGYE